MPLEGVGVLRILSENARGVVARMNHPFTRILRIDQPQSASLVETAASFLQLSPDRIHSLVKLGAVYIGDKRTLEDVKLAEPCTVRVHISPSRYPQCAAVNWDRRIVKETKHYVIVNKPPRIPVNQMVDNVHECVETQMSNRYGSNVTVCHRIDTPTRGLVVLSRTAEFTSAFNALLRQRKVSFVVQGLKSLYACLFVYPCEQRTMARVIRKCSSK